MDARTDVEMDVWCKKIFFFYFPESDKSFGFLFIVYRHWVSGRPTVAFMKVINLEIIFWDYINRNIGDYNLLQSESVWWYVTLGKMQIEYI